MTHQFSDRPFAIGSLFGIRSFRVANDGTLTGVVHQKPWRGGANEAICTGGLQAAFASAKVSMAEMSWALEKLSAAMSGKVLLKKRPKPPEPKPHAIGTLGCTCGFYAYFDRGHNPHHHEGNMLGIVEGFGVMTVGSRGFRCSKARIRALIVEDPNQGFDLAKVMPNYPGVPVFSSVEAALAEFPLTVPEGTPEPSIADMTGAVTVTLTFDTRAWEEAVAKIRRSLRYGISPPARGDSEKETPQERALRLRRERNTGPASRLGLDGHFRR